jgi:hypothetical protein
LQAVIAEQALIVSRTFQYRKTAAAAEFNRSGERGTGDRSGMPH